MPPALPSDTAKPISSSAPAPGNAFSFLDRRPGLISLAIGAASACAFKPLGLWPLMPIALAVLCELLARAPSRREALKIGWLFGLGNFTVGLNWIQTAFTFQDKMPHWLGYIAVVLLALYLAIYPALAAGLAWRLGKGRSIALVLALAGAWGLTEWLRAKLFTGFAWNPIGVTLIDTPWLSTSSSIGTYGLSLLVALAGGGLWLAARQLWSGTLGIAAIFLLALTLPKPMIPDCCLKTFDAAQPQGVPLPPPPPPLPRSDPAPAQMSAEQQQAYLLKNRVFDRIRIVQPNIGQEDKWRPGFADEAARRLALLSGQNRSENPRLLFWPEAAVTEPLEDARTDEHQAFAEFERTRAAQLLRPGDLLLTGGIAFHSTDGRRVTGAANSVFLIDSSGRAMGRYDKAHLVPFGEYLPIRPLLAALGLSRLAPGDVDFTPGPGPRTLATPGWGKVGFQLCYEIIFSGEVTDRANRPDFIFNPSNDAWFGRWGPPQHLAQAQLRAAEEGLPVIRSTPTGISAIIDASGSVTESLPWQKAGAIDGLLPMPAQPTLFARFGNIIPLSLAFLLLIVAIALAARRRYSRT